MFHRSCWLLAAVYAGIVGASTLRAAEPDKLLPPDSDTVIYINFKQLLGSDIIKKYALEQIKQALDGQEAKQLLQDMGLNPLEDIEKVWIGTSGKDRDDMKGLIVVHGKFDPEKLFKAAEAASKKDADTFSMVKDGDVVMFKYQSEEGNPVYGTVVDEKTIVAGSDKNVITKALKQSREEKPAPLNPQLKALLKPMDEKWSIFAVSIVKGKFNDVNIPGELPIDLSGFTKALPNADTLSIVVKIAANIDLEVTFGMKDEDAATEMADGLAKMLDNIKQLVPLLIAVEPQAKPLADVVKTLTTDTKEKNVMLKGQITGENLGKLLTPPEEK
ncbi:MAG: hypothetical protein RMJ56_00865 [Gemmataceae bacterium]|nr:hypothetical protein [Gemmata sp.]MDW8196132.1 hypothetical protein [Gemmataceae bacterium]